jgi:XTP/dITP diphosphohydrolase
MAFFCAMQLVFATNNPHKIHEIGNLLGESFNLCGLEEMGIRGELPEDQDTLEGNASQKAWYVYHRLKMNCFADDTGLEVDGLNGAPGVYSARYSRIGDPVFPEMEVTAGNIRKLLLQMEGIRNRKARFRTVISLIIDGREHRFEGIVRGEIMYEPAGKEGFGYDPVFRPEGYDRTFAQMGLSLKNRISHRARAVGGLVEFLRNM